MKNATVALACLLLALPGVSVGAAPGGEAIPFTVLECRSGPGTIHTRDQVIRDAASWEALWRELHGGSDTVPRPEVDFAHRMVVLVSLDKQPNVEAQVAVRRVERYRVRHTGREGVVVHVEEVRAGGGCFVLPAFTEPYCVAVLEASWDVTFRRSTRYRRCD